MLIYTKRLKDNKILIVTVLLISVTFGLFIGFDCRLTLIKRFQPVSEIIFTRSSVLIYSLASHFHLSRLLNF